MTELFVIVDGGFVIPVGFRIDDEVDVVAANAVEVPLAIIDLIGLAIAENGGFNLLEEGIIFDGCFKRELFTTAVVRFGN